MKTDQRFVVLFGDDTALYSERLTLEAARRGGDESLVAEQVRQHKAGILACEVVRSRYGWTVRAASGLSNFQIMFKPSRLDGQSGLAECIAWTRAWTDADPSRRWAFLRRADVDAADARILWAGKHARCLVCDYHVAASDAFEENLAGNDSVCRWCNPTKMAEEDAARRAALA